MAAIFFNVCDLLSHEGAVIEAEHLAVPVKFGKIDFEVDLCGPDYDHYVKLLQPLVDAGRKPGKQVAPQRRTGIPQRPASEGGKGKYKPNSPDGMHFLCRWPDGDCERKHATAEWPGYDRSQGRGMHERQSHAFSFTAWEKEQQELQPA